MVNPGGLEGPEGDGPDYHPEELEGQKDIFKNKLLLPSNGNTSDFDAWVSLISSTEETSVNDIEAISFVYRSFLLEFPLCYGYWIKYAAHKARLCTYEDVVEVYEQAVQAVPHSVDLWVSYCGFGMSVYEDPSLTRSLFQRGTYLVGKDYLCHHLWDKYIEFENSQKQLIQLATIYINSLKFPTKKLHKYYESFKMLVKSLEQGVTHCGAEISTEDMHTSEVMEADESEGDISTNIAGLFDQGGHLQPGALKQYLFAGDRLYQKSSKLNEQICGFEASIRRPFFHVKPLDDDQLENWNRYLDFVEKNGDFDWAVKLYERCLIPCANYSEFWIRYSEYVDARGGREIANYALGRASSSFVKGVPTFSMYYAMFKEQVGDAPGARALFVKGSSNFTSDFYANVNRMANMEKRMGNTKAAMEIYENAIEDAMQKQNTEVLPDLYTNFAQFKYVASHSIAEAEEVFVKGIKQAPCKPLIKGFIHFMSTYGGSTEIPLLDSLISNAVTPGSDVSTSLSREDREDISLSFLKFVDLYGDVQLLRKAWARHSKLFPHNTRNLPRRCTTDSNKRRLTEFLRVAHGHTPEGTTTLKQSSKSETCSWLIDKKVGLQVDMDAADPGKGKTYADEPKIVGTIDAHQDAGDTAQECIDMAHSQHSLDKHGTQSQMDSHTDQETSHDLSVCEQIDQTTKSHASVSEKAPQAESCNYDSPSKPIADTEQIDAQDEVKPIQLSGIDHPETVCSRSDSRSGEILPEGGIPSGTTQIFPGLEENQHEKIHVNLEKEHDVSVSNAKAENSTDSPEATQCDREISARSQDHIQCSQAQVLFVCAEPSSSGMATTQMAMCSQFSLDNAVTAQAPLQHKIDNSQAYQSSNLCLAGQNMQQQGLTYAISQNVPTSSQTQAQLVAQPNQGNQQYLQMMQGYASQMWQYYQQQLCYLQAQHNQQIQSLQQQELPTEHLQQSFTQQVQQLNQQMVLWQQQVQQQQQQQQQQPVQQQSDKAQDQQYHSSSGDSKHGPDKHQQQESQIDHENQQFQQQQLLYFQQQQQMYFMQQQQQMYQQQQHQQQQLLQQQQYLSQMPQQQDVAQQQQLFQQQQQQLYEQQQKELIVLQQQQQQFAQQQMQQYLQQQAKQQGPNDQELRAKTAEEGGGDISLNLAGVPDDGTAAIPRLP